MDDKKTRDLSANAPVHGAAASDPADKTALPPPQNVEPMAEGSLPNGDFENAPEQGIERHIQQGMLQLLEEMQRLRRDFDTKVKYDESKERQIMLLHNELQHRDNLHFTILRPMLLDLIALYDDISKMLDGSREDPFAAPQWRGNMQSIQDTIEEVLRQNGAEAFHMTGTTITPERQRIVKAIETDDPALDKQVARRLRKGFLYDTKVLRPEWVEVYRYRAESQE
jgi:molecular chaperone GrpE